MQCRKIHSLPPPPSSSTMTRRILDANWPLLKQYNHLPINTDPLGLVQFSSVQFATQIESRSCWLAGKTIPECEIRFNLPATIPLLPLAWEEPPSGQQQQQGSWVITLQRKLWFYLWKLHPFHLQLARSLTREIKKSSQEKELWPRFKETIKCGGELSSWWVAGWGRAREKLTAWKFYRFY